MLVTMRGEQGEFNPWQIPMGQSAGKLLTTAGVQTFPVFDNSQLADTVDEAARQVFENSVAAAVLISQSILGTKTFEN